MTAQLGLAQELASGKTFRMAHKDFMEVIAPMFPQGTEAPHITAVLKRAGYARQRGTGTSRFYDFSAVWHQFGIRF